MSTLIKNIYSIIKKAKNEIKDEIYRYNDYLKKQEEVETFRIFASVYTDGDPQDYIYDVHTWQLHREITPQYSCYSPYVDHYRKGPITGSIRMRLPEHVSLLERYADLIIYNEYVKTGKETVSYKNYVFFSKETRLYAHNGFQEVVYSFMELPKPL